MRTISPDDRGASATCVVGNRRELQGRKHWENVDASSYGKRRSELFDSWA